jgi:hypothetical protein
MAVYVDQLTDYSAIAKNNGKGWKYGNSCHLIADTVTELIDFAVSIGLRREWYQPTSSPHFDLTAGKRRIAVQRGAIELADRREFVAKIQEIRAKAATETNVR